MVRGPEDEHALDFVKVLYVMVRVRSRRTRVSGSTTPFRARISQAIHDQRTHRKPACGAMIARIVE